jgi:hypothetical protein
MAVMTIRAILKARGWGGGGVYVLVGGLLASEAGLCSVELLYLV